MVKEHTLDAVMISMKNGSVAREQYLPILRRRLKDFAARK